MAPRKKVNLRGRGKPVKLGSKKANMRATNAPATRGRTAPRAPPSETSTSSDDISVHTALDEPSETVDRDTGARERAELSSSLDVDGSTRARASRLPATASSSVQQGSPPTPVDVADRIPGLYRILDLMSEQSSGGSGLVDKIIIAQESFGRFANDVRGGAYQSMTHVNFRLLDTAQLKPLGVYGSRPEIVRYLQDLSFIDDNVSQILLKGRDEMPASQALRAGLYLLRKPNSEQVHVVFWPQDTTWDDNAISSVQRNRITFMRYLTKIADQIIVLMSEEHASAIVWGDEEAADTLEEIDDDDDDERLFTYSVAKTKEEQENVTPLPGFAVSNLNLDEIKQPEDPAVTPDMLAPRLVTGETSLSVMTVAYEAARGMQRVKVDDLPSMGLTNLITTESFRLSKSLSESSLQILISKGLDQIAAEECAALSAERSAVENRLRQEWHDTLRQLDECIEVQKPLLVEALRFELARMLTSKYEIFSHDTFAVQDMEGSGIPTVDTAEARQLLRDLTAMHNKLQQGRQLVDIEAKFSSSGGPAFRAKKEEFLASRPSLAQRLIDSLPSSHTYGHTYSHTTPSAPRTWTGRLGEAATSMMPKPLFSSSSASAHPKTIPDPDFLALVPAILRSNPDNSQLESELGDIVDAARQYFIVQIADITRRALKKIDDVRRAACEMHLRASQEHARKMSLDGTRHDFLARLGGRFQRHGDRFVTIEDVQILRATFGRYDSYRITGTEHLQSSATLRYSLRALQVTETDKHATQLDSSHIPTPRNSSVSAFDLSTRQHLVHIQLVQENMCLLVIESQGDHWVYLESLYELEYALRVGRHKKQFRSDKLGGKLVLTYDESKRMLAVCAVEKLQIHVFVFDEHYRNLRGLGAMVDLVSWYEQRAAITHLVFRCGSDEELLIVDGNESGARARILSLTSQQFRPASLPLLRLPCLVLSSPDGSCFFTVEVDDHPILQAYHWASFGSTQGIFIELPGMPIDSLAMCSLISRSHPYFVCMDRSSRTISSTRFHVTHKSTEFTFKSNQEDTTNHTSTRTTVHNSFLDVHRDVWVRFPVVPAVQRQTLKSSHRLPRSLTFICGIPSHLVSRYYSDLAVAFERSTRKPTNGELAKTIVTGVTYTGFMKQPEGGLSVFKAGEWLVDILCLIPIHVAVARDNRFIPLQDGVLTPEFERALLGATVEQVVDRLSFGWYESIFQSYMATKPVQVVSSMGEQSVGKSFALNHLVDTSFAGSAMRTTEGVWMSVTPTEKTLIVALDFEGVHSIERSAQEDSLLVLFNTAISNLVLFRNNFAFSRDISGLFQSFQSSAMVLNPAANPSLFKSLLVIIIKDVVDSDKKEIAKEFSLKFQQIVASEQEDNFISRLHGGELAIIPWPVIESRQFYTSFQTVRKQLDTQTITHHKAGIFLQTMKTLMAKLKTNDWGSLDQNLASHRAQHLQAILPIAFQFGGSETDPAFEPLKDIDNGLDLDVPDVLLEFHLPMASAPDAADKTDASLRTLQLSWSRFTDRQHGDDESWTDELGEYLAGLATARIDYIRKWLSINTERFNGDATTFQGLHREFETLAIALRSSVQLCKMQCAECQLLCLKARHHTGVHGCDTNHHCIHVCAFDDGHKDMDVPEPCGLPAGHPGEHICDISVHLCGKPCHLSDKTGCLKRCSKVVNHFGEEHMCPASLHECGLPCNLSEITLPDGSVYSCPEKCYISSEQHHIEHICKQQSCPLTCQLPGCRRLCSEPFHLHGLDRNARHLCGQEHACSSLCQSRGICRIETTPQSVDVTFTGRHDTFQYTKYSQESKHLQCVVTIPAGETEHTGAHVHTLDPKNFHYCQTRCPNCGYFCTLPLDHAQQEHETSHGSMSRTRWAVEDDTSIIEVNGRRFGANDDGAPLLCSMLCQELGRHVHIEYCQTQPGQPCAGNNQQHITARMLPEPDRPKDFISHERYWRRLGFKDPYAREDRDEFAKCDAMCAGREHEADANGPAHPSLCTQPIFHAALAPGDQLPGGVGYISGDGHHFSCRNPALLQQAFHVIFVIDRSGSMGYTDRRPLSNTPVTARIVRSHNNRLGAVYSSLFTFWNARHTAVAGAANRRDAYSVILFDDSTSNPITNNFDSTPEELVNTLLLHGTSGGTNYDRALGAAQTCMDTHWSTERSPVIIFLSDGECTVQESIVREVCRRAIAKGRPLSLHTVAFGPHNAVLRRMADIATEVQRNVPANPMHPVLPSSYAEALDSVRLAETFLGIADSLTKPRGALIHG